ncbi:MAG: S8 family peptidase, partial [Thermoplasmatota archaeon]
MDWMVKAPVILASMLFLLAIPLDQGPSAENDRIHRYFVVGASLEVMDRIREDLRGLELSLGEPLKYVPYQEIVLKDTDILDRVLAIPGVCRVIEEASVDPSLYVSAKNVKAVPSKDYTPHTAHDLGYRGEGITIVIIDSGVDNHNHPSFIGAFVAGADFSSPESPLNPRDGSVDPDDLDGHGTGVASVALGRGDSVGTPSRLGIAPEAGLIDLRIRKLGPTLENPIAAALEWCMDNEDTDWGNGYSGIDVISISAGLGNPGGPVHSLISMCVENGMPVVSAATNSGEPFEDNPDGPNYWSDDSIIVGGTDDMDTIDRADDEYWPQSTWGPRTDDGDDDPYDELKPDISAPASEIMVAEAQDKGSPGPIV